MLLNNKWITEEIKEEIKKYLEAKDKKDTKVVLKGKFIAIQACLRKQEKSQIKNLTLYLKEVEKEVQTQTKVSRRKEIIKIREDTDEREMKKIIEKINKLKAGSLKRSTKLINTLSQTQQEKNRKDSKQ